MNTENTPRIIHGHVDAGLLRLIDEQIYSTRFMRDPMPIDHCRAVLIVLPNGSAAMRRAARWTCVEGMPHRCMFLAGVFVFQANGLGAAL